MKNKKLAIITTHPVQYNAPVFRLLQQRGMADIAVWYTLGDQFNKMVDKGFDKIIEWDIPLLDGYPYQFCRNIAAQPGSDHFNGIENPELIEQVEAWQPDAVLVFGWSYKSHWKLIRHFKGRIPVWFRGDSHMLDEQPLMRRIARKIWLGYVYSKIAKAFYTGSANKDYYEQLGVGAGKLVFAPHATDNQRFSADRKMEAETLRTELGIPQDAIVFLYAGKFEEKKSPLFLLQAFEKAAGNNQWLIMAGDGKLAVDISEFHAGMKNGARVKILPFQNQAFMPALYQSAAVFCLPSQGPNETWGLCVNEAMAAGCAILVSNKAGCAYDLVKDGQNGYVLTPADIAAWCSAIEKLSAPALVKAYGKQSEILISDWSFEAIAGAIEKEINE